MLENTQPPDGPLFMDYRRHDFVHDAVRAKLWENALERVVQPGHSVLYMGSDGGVVPMLAARAGASKVHCVVDRSNADNREVLVENARRNGLHRRIRPVVAEGTLAWDLDMPKVDVAIIDLLSPGYFEFDLPGIVQSMRRHLKPRGIFMPDSVRQTAELLDGETEIYGLTFSYDFRARNIPGDRRLTTAGTYGLPEHLNSGEAWPADKDHVAQVTGLRLSGEGMANAVRLQYSTKLRPGGPWRHRPTVTKVPFVLHLPEAVPVEPGANYDIALGPYLPATISPRDLPISVNRA